MKFMVLDKDERWGVHRAEVYQKSLNLVHAINSGDKAVIAEMAIDNIMESLAILYKSNDEGADVHQVLHRYNKKLVNAGHMYKGIVKIKRKYGQLILEEIKESRGWFYQQIKIV